MMVSTAPLLSGPDPGVVHQAVGGEYGVNDQTGPGPKWRMLSRPRSGTGGDLLGCGEPVPGEHGVDPGPRISGSASVSGVWVAGSSCSLPPRPAEAADVGVAELAGPTRCTR